MSTEKPPFETWLAARTAEMLALPHLICCRRACRRKNKCHWWFRGNSEPCCLQNLTAAQRRVFDAVYKRAHFAQGFLGSHSEYFRARDEAQRFEDDMAIDIARTSPIRWNPKKWDAKRRERERRADEGGREA